MDYARALARRPAALQRIDPQRERLTRVDRRLILRARNGRPRA
jgi:hypothetical protein